MRSTLLTMYLPGLVLSMCPRRYVLAYIESYKGVKAGERVWQLGFGSGFKVNSAVWVARKRNNVSAGKACGLAVAGLCFVSGVC